MNTTGSNNTAFGPSTLTQNTTGSDNIVIGHFAGSYLTTGDNNIDVGNAGVEDESAGSTLIATSRFSRSSRARYTSPMPPAPTEETISYGPSREPALRDTLAEI